MGSVKINNNLGMHVKDILLKLLKFCEFYLKINLNLFLVHCIIYRITSSICYISRTDASFYLSISNFNKYLATYITNL